MASCLIKGQETKQQHLSNILIHLRNNVFFRQNGDFLVFCNRRDDVLRVIYSRLLLDRKRGKLGGGCSC